jgi:uncharacterized membrane protein YphA (DoxX/SURF4 family)
MSTAAVAPASPRPAARGRAARVALWALQIALAAAFLGAGGSKLAGTPDMVALFDAVGVGQWFRYVTGVLEIAGAILLLVPSLAGLGALHLAGVMAGAILAHFARIHTPPVAPAVLLALLAVVAFARRREIAALLSRARR